MKGKVYIIGADGATDALALRVASVLGCKPLCTDGATSDEISAAASEHSWVIYGSSYSDIEAYLRSAGLIAVVTAPRLGAGARLRALDGEARARRLAALKEMRTADGRAKLDIRLNHFAYKVRRVRGAAGARRFVNEVASALGEADS